MATVKSINIVRNEFTRKRQDNGVCNMCWFVNEGEPYDVVNFSINELDKSYFWNVTLCVPCGLSEDEINSKVKEYAETITEKQIADYRNFLEMGEIYGWD